jgi:hypothetical protein
MEGYRFVSGIPAVGTLLLLIPGIVGFGATGTVVLLLAILLVDTGGLHWFVFMTWRDRGLWDS